MHNNKMEFLQQVSLNITYIAVLFMVLKADFYR